MTIVLFAQLFSQCKIVGRPMESQGLEDGHRNITRGTSVAEKGTLVIRDKRHSKYFNRLKDYCNPYTCAGSQCSSSSSNPCVKGQYLCRGFVEIACKEDAEDFIQSPSFFCLQNLPKYGFAKCFPYYKWVRLSTGEKVKQTVNCTCTRNWAISDI